MDDRSDLDFAVEGLDSRELAGTWSELDQKVSLPVDLIRWEEASPTLQKEIIRWGKILYET